MKGPDKLVWIEKWKYGVLVDRKQKDDPTANNSNNRGGQSSRILDPMRPESGLLSEEV